MSNEERHKKVNNETKRRHQNTHERWEGINEGWEGACDSEKTADRSQRSVICCGFAVEEEDVGFKCQSGSDRLGRRPEFAVREERDGPRDRRAEKLGVKMSR
jgi:hypothetical protein